MRIVSLLPSATEIVCAIGLGDELVGVTHECDYPAEVVGKPVMTRSTHDLSRASSRDIHRLVTAAVHGGSSLYVLDEEALEAAAPDLILTQDLCRVCAVSYREVNEVARAIDADITVVSLEPASIEGILNTITTIGAMTESEDAADRPGRVAPRTPRCRRRAAAGPPRRRWPGATGRRARVAGSAVRRRPLGARAGAPAGGWEVLGAAGEPSRQSTWDAVGDVDPEMVLLMPCGFHLAETVDAWASDPATPRLV